MDVNWNVNLPSLWLTYLIALRKDTFTEHLLYSSSSHGGWEGYISNRVDSVIQNSSIRHSQKNFADHLGVPVACVPVNRDSIYIYPVATDRMGAH